MMEPVMFLEDVYITGICRSHCHHVKMVPSAAFRIHGSKYDMDQFRPESDVLIHSADANRTRHWYKMTLDLQRQREKQYHS